MKKVFTVLSVLSVLALSAQNTNYGFESWTIMPAIFPAPAYDDPNDWNSLNSLTVAIGVLTSTKATDPVDVYSGAFAVKLVTKIAGGTIANGLITTGTIDAGTSSVGGGVAYTLRPDSIIGWYKYAPVSGDSGFVEIQLLGAGGDTDTIGYAIFRTPAADVTTYTRFSTPIVYRDTAPVVKSLWILSSSASNTVHFENSTMFIDDIQLGSDSFAATTIDENQLSALKIGPNPVTSKVIISNSDIVNGVFTLYDIVGNTINTTLISSSTTTVNVANLAAGTYIYVIRDTDEVVIKSGKLVVQ